MFGPDDDNIIITERECGLQTILQLTIAVFTQKTASKYCLFASLVAAFPKGFCATTAEVKDTLASTTTSEQLMTSSKLLQILPAAT